MHKTCLLGAYSQVVQQVIQDIVIIHKYTLSKGVMTQVTVADSAGVLELTDLQYSSRWSSCMGIQAELWCWQRPAGQM